MASKHLSIPLESEVTLHSPHGTHRATAYLTFIEQTRSIKGGWLVEVESPGGNEAWLLETLLFGNDRTQVRNPPDRVETQSHGTYITGMRGAVIEALRLLLTNPPSDLVELIEG